MCQACDLPERLAMEQDIRDGMPPAPVAKKYGIRHHAVVLQHERRHMRQQPESPTQLDTETHSNRAVIELAPVYWYESRSSALRVDTEPPFVRFKQAWMDASDDQREQARMVQWLNDQLQADEMGL